LASGAKAKPSNVNFTGGRTPRHPFEMKNISNIAMMTTSA